jgi:hypothetical protein
MTLGKALDEFNHVVDVVENRCMAADGPVTPTLREMREDELAQLWRAAQVIHQHHAIFWKLQRALRACRRLMNYYAEASDAHVVRANAQAREALRPV